MGNHRIVLALAVALLWGCAAQVAVEPGDGGVDAACPEGLQACGGLCVDLRSDPSHCGSCAVTCGSTEVCSGATCQVACVPGTDPCGRSCVDLQSDPRNCGSCGVTCPTGTYCSDGECKDTCDSGLTDCAGACVDLATDRYHCGDCDTACPADQTCVASDCAAICVPQCADRQCGPDGCAGTCSPGCGTGTCLADGTCCPGTACGTSCCALGAGCLPSGACCDGTVCGSACCASGETCMADGTCCAGTACGTACCAAGQLCASGACCAPTWALPYAGVNVGSSGAAAALGDDGLLYFTGQEITSAYVGVIDACGAVIREETFLPAGCASASGSGIALGSTGIFVAGTMVYAAGTNPQDGMYARLNRTTLNVVYTNPLTGGVDSTDEGWGVAVADNSSIWLSGSASYTDPVNGAPWAIQGVQSGNACGWRAFGTTGGTGRGLLTPPGTGRAYFTGAADGKLTLAGWPTAGCWSSGDTTCPACTAVFGASATIAGAVASEGRALAVVGGRAYVAGFADMGAAANGAGAIVVEIDLATAQVLGTYSWNPTAAWDGFLGITTDGANALYAVGAQGWDGVTIGTATAIAVKLTLPGLVESWQRTFADADLYATPVLDGSGALYLVGTANGAAHVRRCLIDGTCP